MKKLAILTLTIFAFFFCHCSFAQSTFQRSYSSFNSYTSSLTPNKTGYFVVGNMQTDSTLGDVLCVSTDKKGNLAWSKSYGTFWNEGRSCVIATSDDGILLFIQTSDYVNHAYDGALVIKCDASGNIIWSKKIRSANFPNIYPAYATEDSKGNYLLLFDENKDQFANHFFGIAQIDTQGNLVWQQTFKTLSFDWSEAGLVTETDKHELLVTCDLVEGELNIRHPSILRLNKQGKPVSFKSLCTLGCASFSQAEISNLSENNNQISALGYFSDEFKPHLFYYQESDTSTIINASLIANNIFSLQFFVNNNTIQRQGNNPLYGNIINKDGSMLIPILAPKLGLYKYDDRGRICPDYIRPKIDTTQTNTTFIYTDQPLNTTRDEISLTNITVQARDINIQQNICSGSATLISSTDLANANATSQVNKTGTTVYPNPVKDVLHIKFSGTTKIILLNSSGAVVKTATITNEEAIDVHNLSGGLYYLKNLSNGTIQKIMIVR